MDERTPDTQPAGHKLYKYLCICADDFALSEVIDAGIVDLLQQSRLQAVSCMTQSPRWQSSGKHLIAFSHHADIGLHFNLTQPFVNASCPPSYSLSQLMRQSWLRTVDRNTIVTTLQQQWDSFVNVMGQKPDYVDGHQHIHQFPVIRDVLIDFLQQQRFNGWVRGLQAIKHVQPYGFKSRVLQQLGAKQLHKLCQRAHLAQNQAFIGVYDFAVDADYGNLMQAWLSQIEDNALLMCHPALPLSIKPLSSDNPTDIYHPTPQPDGILAARVKEYQYLCSTQFAKQLQQFNLQLLPLSKLITTMAADQIGG